MIIFLFWYLVILAAGILYLPTAMLIFRGWRDRGWVFSKSLGIFLGAYFMWVLNCLHAVRFRTVACVICLAVPAAVGAGLYVLRRKREAAYAGTGFGKWFLGASFPWKRILFEELGFLLLMALWTWIIGFRPQAYGTEKFMDYAFITSMLRSDYMPAPDPWYAGKTINYYYGGQYITAYLIRLSQVRAGEGYTLMRAFITAMSFMLPFSLAAQMLEDRISGIRGLFQHEIPGKGRRTVDAHRADGAGEISGGAGILPDLAGMTAGLAVAFCGNFHYVVYGILVPVISKITGGEGYHYWFPESTRYIGYHPDAADKTIHEFPSYSSVLGDLHAHYINILFVVLVTAIAYAWARKRQAEAKRMSSCLRQVFCPEILLIGCFTGIFRWTNFWDFPIYFVVCGAVIFFMNLRMFRHDAKRFGIVMIAQAVVMFLAGTVTALPFTLTFAQISGEVGRTWSHSPLYQLMILWWLPVSVTVGYVAMLIRDRVLMLRTHKEAAGEDSIGTETDGEEEPAGKTRVSEKKIPWYLQVRDFFNELPLPDLAAGIFGVCAMGLVWLPEVIYVKDIYTTTHYRANTMFKLTYQAFILFGIVMGYVLIRVFALRAMQSREAAEEEEERAASGVFSEIGRIRTGLAVFALVMLLLTGGYIFRSTKDWFGNIFIKEDRISTDASVFISEDFPSDYGAVSWLNAHVEGQPVTLEATGDSYTDFGRVSAATGLPTVMGWYVHEWLWRNNTDEQNEREADIETIYTSTNADEVLSLIRKYNIRYIYIGTLEREAYPELNDLLLQELGTVAYSDGVTTYIMEY